MKTLVVSITTLFLIGCSTLLYAQPPGYLGKRTVLEVSASLNPYALVDPLMDGFKPNPGVGLSYRRVVGERVSIGTSFHYRSMGRFTYDGFTSDKATNEMSLLFETDLHRKRKWGGMAPIGFHLTTGLGLIRFGSVPGNFNDWTPNEIVEFRGFTSVVGRINIGYRYVLKDKVSISPWSGVDLSGIALEAMRSRGGSRAALPTNGVYMLWRCGVNVGILR